MDDRVRLTTRIRVAGVRGSDRASATRDRLSDEPAERLAQHRQSGVSPLSQARVLCLSCNSRIWRVNRSKSGLLLSPLRTYSWSQSWKTGL